MPKLLIKNANELVSPVACPSRGKSLNELRVWQNGSLYIENETIAEIGHLQDFENKISQDTVIIDASGKTVLPGFVDSHTHLVFAGTREEETAMRISGATYQEIAAKGGGILSTVKATRAASKAELKKIARHYLAIALEHGTTTMEIKSGYGLELETELKILQVIEELGHEQPIELVPTFMGAHAVPPEHDKTDYVAEVISMLPKIATKAKFCDVFCENGYFDLDDSRQILEHAKQLGLIPRMHVDQFSNNGGVKLGVDLGATSVDHLEKISDEEISALAASNTCATLLPGVSFFLNYGYPPARKIIDQGCITALATNFNPGSCMTFSMQMIIAIACLQMRMTAEEAINAATANGAYALGLDDVGILEVGKQADIIILDVPNYRMLPYFFGVNHVEKVIKRGEIVWSR
jgi:imidazolonepropionase